MKVLLVSANRERIPYPVAPLGLLYLAETLKKDNFKVSILDLCFSDNISEDIKGAVECFSPDIIGLSVRNIDNLSYPGVISYLPDIKHIINIIKSSSSVPIILGGSAFSLFPEEILRYMECDIGVIGEGERALVRLAKTIENGKKDFKNIDNVIYRSGEEVHRCEIAHDDGSDFIVKRDLIENALYSKYGGMGNIQTKRGCQFSCSYCTYPLLEGKKYRLRSPEIIVEEIALAQNEFNINHFFVVDSVFNYPKEHAQEICESIIAKNLSITWSCFASPAHVSKKLLAVMKKAGCANIEFGSDALSPETLGGLQKSFSVDDILLASELCKEAGIKCAHYVIFGGPGETQATLQQTFKNIEQLKCNAVIAMVGIRIYPRTKLQSVSVAEGIIDKDEDLLEPRFYLSPQIPLEALLKEVTDFAAKSSNCIVPGLGIKSSEKMFDVLRKHYKEGPLWGYLR